MEEEKKNDQARVGEAKKKETEKQSSEEAKNVKEDAEKTCRQKPRFWKKVVRSVCYQMKEAYSSRQEKVTMMHKDMLTAERTEQLKKFAQGEVNVLVCTDLVQRGLDLPNCEHVVNFDFPLNSIDPMDAWPAGASAELLPPCGSIHLHGGKAGVKDDSFDRFRKNFVEQGKKALPYFFARVNIAIVSCGFRPDVFWQELGNVTEVSIQTREDADSPQLVAVIDAAQCVWFTGGDQSRFRGLLHGSQLQTSLQRLLKRSGALGGAAAGASLLCAICPNFDEIFEGLDLLRGADV
ncbi:unnamed protein product [Effrenium voratum]|uniref:Helicase C-terminal domain-containing protein n=1 Tax=Effrenium voratum TaxID=2562239 RepID=A0AA36N3J6_9DINO|nr:unnamed protein product [Effrenium voratum]